METNNLFNNLIQRNQSAAFSSGKVRPNHETNINIIARRTGKDVNSHTVLDGIITTIMATIQRINIIGSREGSRNRRRLKANQTGKKFRVGIKSNISTNRIIPMLCVTIFVILVVWFLLPRVARLMIHTPTAISIFVCLSMVQLMAVFISMRCTLCGHFLQVALTLILVVGYAIAAS